MMFYKETNFKETPIGKVPKDWIIDKLGTLCRFKRGFSYRSSQITSSRTQIRFLTINDIEKEGGLKREAEKLYIREGVEIDPEFFVDEGDVFIANTDMAKGFIIGAPVLMKNIDEKYVYSMDLTKLIFNKAEVDSGFLFYYLTHPSMRRRMKAAAQGTNVLHLNHVIVRNFFIPLPPFPEQQKIAEILSTIDEAIQKTNEIIAKTERLKKGLMQELLTKGIGHKEFKDTEIGRIPKEWEVVRLETIGDIVNGFAFPIKYQGKKNGKYIFAKVSDTNLPGNEKYISVTENTIDDEVAEKLGVKIYPSGTIIFPKIGMVIYLRKVRILTKAGTFDNNIMGIIPNEKIINREFLYYLLLEKIDLTKLIGKTTTPSIRKSEVKKLKIPCPSLSEQQKIVEILLAIDKKLEIGRKEKVKLERIKQGLMDLLLTGKIRVRI